MNFCLLLMNLHEGEILVSGTVYRIINMIHDKTIHTNLLDYYSTLLTMQLLHPHPNHLCYKKIDALLN